jgi:hypothetical protein
MSSKTICLEYQVRTLAAVNSRGLGTRNRTSSGSVKLELTTARDRLRRYGIAFVLQTTCRRVRQVSFRLLRLNACAGEHVNCEVYCMLARSGANCQQIGHSRRFFLRCGDAAMICVPRENPRRGDVTFVAESLRDSAPAFPFKLGKQQVPAVRSRSDQTACTPMPPSESSLRST